MAARVPPRLEVVGDQHAVEPDLLGAHGVLDQLARPELLRRRLVADPQRHLPVLLPRPPRDRGPCRLLATPARAAPRRESPASRHLLASECGIRGSVECPESSIRSPLPADSRGRHARTRSPFGSYSGPRTTSPGYPAPRRSLHLDGRPRALDSAGRQRVGDGPLDGVAVAPRRDEPEDVVRPVRAHRLRPPSATARGSAGTRQRSRKSGSVPRGHGARRQAPPPPRTRRPGARRTRGRPRPAWLSAADAEPPRPSVALLQPQALSMASVARRAAARACVPASNERAPQATRRTRPGSTAPSRAHRRRSPEGRARTLLMVVSCIVRNGNATSARS